MKLPTTLHNKKGFLTAEVMLAFAIMTLFTISTFTLISSIQGSKVWSVKMLSNLEDSVFKADEVMKNNFQDISKYISEDKINKYGNDTNIYDIYPFTLRHSDHKTAWGRDTCLPRFDFNEDNIRYFERGVDIGGGNISSDIEVRNKIIYLTADSTTASQKDFYIIDATSLEDVHIISALNTGPGLRSIEIAGPYAFAAQSSTGYQLQVIDIHDRGKPKVVSQLKLLLPTPTTTAPYAKSIFYSKEYLYIGTEKWGGAEFSIIDTHDVYHPIVVGTFETGTLINDIYIIGNTAYLASSDEKQMRIVDIYDKTNPTLVGSFSSSGWQTQEGRTLEYFENKLGFGRTVGGFNVVTNHEAFIFPTSSISVTEGVYGSLDIPGGVYGMIFRPKLTFLLTHNIGHEFQIYNQELNKKLFELPLNSTPTKMTCDGSILYFSTGDNKGVSVLKIN